MDTFKTEFNAAEKYLKYKGHIVLNPAVHPLGMKYESYLLIDQQMVNVADGIVMLRGWKSSNGSKHELRMAIKHGKKVFFGIESVPANRGDDK